MRLAGKAALVIGAGQTPGDTIGNGRATSLVFAREGARVLAVDRNLASAEETAALIRDEGGECETFEADVTDGSQCRDLVAACIERFGGLDVLQYNVGIGDGDAGATHLAEEAWDQIHSVNLKSAFLVAKYALPPMRERQGGCMTFVSSVASLCSAPMLAYKTSKAGLNALTHALAMGNAKYGIRVNAILPGLMNTPMAIEKISATLGVAKQQLIERRDAQVPLGGRMGTAWDVANAALFLASDEARFITGVLLPVDGGQSARIG